MRNFNFYKNNEFIDKKPIISNKYRALEEYEKIKNVNKLLSLGREFMTRGNRDGYYHALWCFDAAICHCPDSFEAHLGVYKAWLWFCISVFEEPFSILGNDLYDVLRIYTPEKDLDEIRDMYENDILLVADMLEYRRCYEEES